ncbi:MAG: TrmH family RNA methyltransferase [Bacteroidales bacterium]|nr:TrmH family RNA methyltransferase [Bacteroidales bacterium]
MKKINIKSRELFQNKKYFIETAPLIIAIKIKTPQNIGNIIRLADNIGCTKIIFIDSKPYPKVSKIKITASSSLNSVKWEFRSLCEIKDIIPDDYMVYAIETSHNSENIYDISFPKKSVFIVGNEIRGIDNDILDLSNKIIHIPMTGKNKSMNVSHALSVALFEWLRQQL